MLRKIFEYRGSNIGVKLCLDSVKCMKKLEAITNATNSDGINADMVGRGFADTLSKVGNPKRLELANSNDRNIF